MKAELKVTNVLQEGGRERKVEERKNQIRSASSFFRRFPKQEREGVHKLTRERSLLKTGKRRKRGDLALEVSRRALPEFRSRAEAAGSKAVGSTAAEFGNRWAAGTDRA